MSDMNPGNWTAKIVGLFVLVVIVVALLPSLLTALADYTTAEPIFGAIMEVLVPILVGAGIVLAVVAAFLPGKFGGKA